MEIEKTKGRRGRPKSNKIEGDDSKFESNIKTINDPLIEPYSIQIDQYCYTVLERITPDIRYTSSGKEYIKPVGHYTNFNSCLEAIAKCKTNSKNYNSIKAFIKEYGIIKDEMKNLTHI